ncbi:hypothetical protein SH467x_000558 [Pirellulaceae bacterium SH467]
MVSLVYSTHQSALHENQLTIPDRFYKKSTEISEDVTGERNLPHNRIKFRNRLISAFPWAFDFYESVCFVSHASEWRRSGLSIPCPSLLKRAILLQEIKAFKAENFIETGTYLGDTPWYLRKHLKRIVSIEVHPPLADLARTRFKKIENVTIAEGDSGTILSQFVKDLNGRTVFWLDGHYSGGITGIGEEECPIFRELTAIISLCRTDWLILIDDARCFGSHPAYPTIEEIAAFFKNHRKDVKLSVANDIIRIQDVSEHLLP